MTRPDGSFGCSNFGVALQDTSNPNSLSSFNLIVPASYTFYSYDNRANLSLKDYLASFVVDDNKGYSWFAECGVGTS